jgi:hypothetical protein
MMPAIFLMLLIPTSMTAIDKLHDINKRNDERREMAIYKEHRYRMDEVFSYPREKQIINAEKVRLGEVRRD